MRELNPLIENYVDSRIAPYDPKTVSPSNLLVGSLKAMLGIMEEGGNNRGKLVAAIQDTVGNPDPLAWCMSLQQTAVAFVEKKLSLHCDLFPSEHCLTVFNDAKRRKQIVSSPLPGDLIVWRQGDTLSGHVGCISALLGERFLCIEGNTSGGTGIEREGDGVFEKTRSLAPMGKMKVLGLVRLQWTRP